MTESTDVAIIGAGPAGSVAGALLKKCGLDVVILEQNRFPRFSIGESLLPHCMEFVAQAGMLDAVNAEGFQFKNGARFACAGRQGSFDFREKFSAGPGTTFQVQRARFDQVLAEAAIAQDVDIRFQRKITDVRISDDGSSDIVIEAENGEHGQLNARFLLDASGFGRVLPRLFGLETPSDFPVRRSVFTHIQDNIVDSSYDREKILIVIHPEQRDVWYWLIPFSNGRCSLGVVAETQYFDSLGLEQNIDLLQAAVKASPDLSTLLADAVYDTPVQNISGYACNVSSLWGKGFALLGNAGEFLDPVFSSGVTIAMKSASLAAPLVQRQLTGDLVDWEREYAQPLKRGVDTFRAYVNGWYSGMLQDIIFMQGQAPEIRAMVCSILAGYAWDEKNPFVRDPERRLRLLGDLCAQAQ